MKQELGVFVILIVFVSFIFYTDIEYLVNYKKSIYKLASKPLEFVGIDMDSEENNLDRFKIIHDKILSGQLPLKVHFNEAFRYTYMEATFSYITSMVIAILTESALIFNPDGPTLASVIKEPFNGSFRNYTVKQDNFNYQYNLGEIVGIGSEYSRTQTTKNASLFIKTQLPNATRTSFGAFEAYFMAICSNPIYYEKLHQYGLVQREVIDKAKEYVLNADKYTNEELLRTVLQVGFDVGGMLLNTYWTYQENVQERIDYYLINHFREAYVIALHINHPAEQDQTARMIECALEIENIARFELGYKKIKWYVATNHWNTIASLAVEYPNKIIRIDRDLNAVGNIRYWIDLELMSRSDEIIIQGGYVTGFVAAMKSENMPFYIGQNVTKCQRLDLGRVPIKFDGAHASF